VTQEQQNQLKAARLQFLDSHGIEIGSFAGGSPLIQAGTLDRIVEKLSTWIVSGSLDAQSALQINGFLMTYECFTTHEKLLQTAFDQYHHATDPSLPEASREKFAKRRREGCENLRLVLSKLCQNPQVPPRLAQRQVSLAASSSVHQGDRLLLLHQILCRAAGARGARVARDRRAMRASRAFRLFDPSVSRAVVPRCS
jgi:hypothetical protein